MMNMAQLQEKTESIENNNIVNVNVNVGSSHHPNDITNNNNNDSGSGNGNGSSDGGSRSFKFNADAAEFVPRSYSYSYNSTRSSNNNTTAPPNNNQLSRLSSTTGYFYPYVQFLQDAHAHVHWDPDHHHLPSTTSPNWFYANPPPTLPPPSPLHNHIFNNNNNNKADNNNKNNNNNNNNNHAPHSPSFPSNSDDFQQKIIKQVEYLFSDLSLMANDTMAKHVNKDPEGYVPVAVIASMKKIKALVTDHHSLIHPLRSSTKLVVSKDNKKVKRRIPFTENYRDELQGRTVMVENLPDDHSYQNLEKIFRVVGSVKAIRLCHPPEANPCRSKNECISNKLHALVEYENAEMAERAAEKLNDERNWRRGLRVKVMLRRSPKSVLKNRKSDFDMLMTDEEEVTYGESPKAIIEISSPSNNNNNNNNGAEIVIDNSGGAQQEGGEDSPRKAAAGGGRGGRIKTNKGGRNHHHHHHQNNNNNNDHPHPHRGLGLGLLSSPPLSPTTATTPTHYYTAGGSSSSSPLQMQMQIQSCNNNNNDYSIFKQRGVGVAGVGPRMPDGTRGFTMGRGKPLLLSPP